MIDGNTAREARCGVCGVCGEPSVHFRACADCDYTAGRCAAHGSNKSVSRNMVIHRQHEHGVQFQILGTETPNDPVLEIQRPLTRADCVDGPRPCPWVGCRHHLLIEVAHAKPRAGRDARPTSIRLNRAPEPGVLGRRPGLHAKDPTEVVQRWIGDAIEHLERMEHTCSLDVAEQGASLVEVARMLGVTTASIKEEVGPAGDELRLGLKDYEDHAPTDHVSALGRMAGG